MIGTRLLNRYEVVAELGRGGMGVVYRAHDPLLNREIAVKIVPPSLLTAQAEERFQREAQIVAQMDHPSIVPIYDLGRHDGSLFFIMPVVHGVSVRQHVRDKPRSLGEILEIIAQAAEALEYSHSRGVIHRDIKPENIMVAEHEGALRVRIMDFGLARVSTEDRVTKTGTLVGTVAYFSPEQVVSQDLDHRSDIYSLGTVLYECLAGNPPFTGEVQAMLYRIVHEHPRSLRTMGVAISEELDEIVLRTLSKDRARRYERAGDLAEVLRRHHGTLKQSEKENELVFSTMVTAQMTRPPIAAAYIGREKESAELQRRLNNSIDGECHFVVVGGEPGIGKSRLLEELENLARARRIRVLRGRFVEQDRSFSYQGFCEVIQEYFRHTDSESGERADFSDLAPELVSLFPVLNEVPQIRASVTDRRGDAAPEARKADDRTYIYELLARTLIRIGGGRPLLLIFENLHGAEISVDALQYVVRRLGSTPTLITATYRQTEIDKRHPLIRLLDNFSDDPRFASMILGPLSESEHRRFVESIVGPGKLSGVLVQRLYEATDANPYFTRELVRSLVDSGGIARDDSGAWALSGEMAISSEALPATIQQAVEKRIERLPEPEREILAIASVLGKTFEYRDLELLADETKNLDDLVEGLIQQGVIEEDREARGDRLTFSSAIVRDVLYGALSRRKRKSLHRRHAEQLEKRHAGKLERVYPQLVHHFSEGDVPEKTVTHGLKFARRLLDSFSTEEAIQVLKTVLGFLEDDDGESDPQSETEAHFLLATTYRQQGNTEGAMKEADLAARSAHKSGDEPRALRAMLLAAESAWQGRRVEETRGWVDRGIAAARAANDREVLSQLLSLSATVANLRGDYERAKSCLDELDRLAGTSRKALEEAVPVGGTLTVAMTNRAGATEPAQMHIDEDVEILSLVFETLVTTDEQGHHVPLLCHRWELSDDGRSLLIALRSDVHFHDGTPLTAADVKESFQRYIRTRDRGLTGAVAAIRGSQEYRQGAALELNGIEVLSDHELRVHLVEPISFFTALLADPHAGILRTTASGAVVGTGPFRIASSTAEATRLEAAPNYWRDIRPALDAIEFVFLPNAAAVTAGLRKGDIDLGRDLLPDDVEELLRDPQFRNGLVEAPKKNTYMVIFNLNEKLNTLAARQALAGLIRPHDLVWRSLGRMAQPASSVIPPGIAGHDPGRRRRALNREEAVGLLRTAGLELPLNIRVSVHPILQDRYRRLTDALLEVWSSIGVNVEMVTPTLESYLASSKNPQGIDLLIGRWNADYDDPDNFTNSLFRSGSGVFSRLCSMPETDELMEEARGERRPATRELLYRKLENILIDNAAVVPLFHEINYRIGNPKVRRLKLRGTPPYVNYAELGKAEAVEKSAAPFTASEGVIHIPILEDLRKFDPADADTVDKSEVYSAVFDTLTRVTEGAHVIPWLASRIDTEDGARRFRFLLRDGVRFHDGRRLTARDVRYSWERLLSGNFQHKWILAPIRGSADAMRGAELKGFQIVSNLEFVVELDRPLSFFPTTLAHMPSAIVPEGFDVGRGSWKEGCVGTGAFRLVQFDPGRLAVLDRNPHYWRSGYPKSERLVFRLGMRADDIRAEFEAGTLSLASELYPGDVERFRHDPRLGRGYRENPRLSSYVIAFNIHKPPFDNLDVRRRLRHEIDYVSIVRRTIGRLALPAHGVIPPGLLGYSPTPIETFYEPPPRSEETQEVEVTAVVHPIYMAHYSAVFNEIAQHFSRHGFRISVINKTHKEFLETRGSHLRMGRWVADYPDADTFARGMLQSAAGNIGPECGIPEIDTLIERGTSETDPRARHAIYREVQEIASREALFIPLFHEQVYRFARPEVEGLNLSFTAPEVAYENLRVRPRSG